ncbi:MAG TPA: class I SAM-dependent methyltransferase [Solirubrobacteraceae bacterium]|nr:class I SAM-dependent methyltransferase [Solirubrobacteraceae bacterium]
MTAGWQYHEDPRPDVQALIAPRGLRVLDVGCGAGSLAAGLKTAGAAHVAGIELDSSAAARARERLDVVVEGSVLDADLPFREGEFDVLVFADVLEHLPDPDAALRRCLPLLAPGGRVVVSVPNMRFWLVLARLAGDRWAYTDHGVRDRTHLRIFTRRSLLAMLRSHDLAVERLERNQRLLDDQSGIGRAAALASRAVVATLGRSPLRDLLAYQYVVVARRAR